MTKRRDLAAPYLARAAELRKAGRLAELLAPLRQALALEPNNAFASHDLGLTLLNCGQAAPAVEALNRAIAIKPDFAAAWRWLGMALAAANQPEKAIAALQKAIACEPRQSDAHAALAGLLLERGQRRAAAKAYRRAGELARGSPASRLNLARALVIEERDSEAETALRRLVALDPRNSTARWMLGNLFSEAGRFDLAETEFAAAVAADPSQAVAWYDLTRCRHLGAADRALIERMEAALPGLTRADSRALMHLALGKAYDDLGDPGTAMRHYSAANAAKPDPYGFDRRRLSESVDRLIARFTPEFFDRHRSQASPSELPVLILGLPRSGTTLVEQIVASHSAVYGGDELRFWEHQGRAFATIGEDAMVPLAISRIAEEGLRVLRELDGDALRVTDKMPLNFRWAGLIHLVFPAARIIHCRRSPIDTCLSIFQTYFAPRPDFSTKAEDLVFYNAEYERLMAHWRAVLPADRFFEIEYEKLIADPEQATRRMIAFLGLEWDDACLHPEGNPRRVKTASKWQARQAIHSGSLERWRRYEPFLGPFRALLPGAASLAGNVVPMEGPTTREPAMSAPTGAPAPPAQARNPGPPGETKPAPQAAPSIALSGAAGRTILNLGPLSEAGRMREEAERLQRSLYRDPLAALRTTGNSANRERRPTQAGQAEAAERCRRRGNRLLQAGKAAAAIAEFRQATKLDPVNAGLHHALGQAFLRAGQYANAESSFKLAITFGDDFAEAHLDLGKAIEQQGRPFEAIAAFRRAVGLTPALDEGHRRLGGLLESTGDSAAAADSYRRAAAAAPGTALGRMSDAKAFVLEGDFEQAERRLRQAVAAEPNNAQTHKLLGDVLAIGGRFDEAFAAYDRALEADPLLAEAQFAAVQARKCGESDRPRLVRMLSTLQVRGLNDRQRMVLHFTIGKMFDDLREYREAMGHFDAANRLRRRLQTKFDRATFSDQIDRLIRRFTAPFFAQSAAYGCNDETPILIVGMPRSGTTLVEQILAAHPDVAAGGELAFWVTHGSAPWVVEATDLTPKTGHGLSAEYLSLLRRIGTPAARVTDKLPFNFLRLGLIHLLLPRARLIHCRRHPIDTCLSIYSTYFKAAMEFCADKSDLVFEYRNYLRLMDHWRAVLPADRYMEVDYENLVADREAVTRRLIAFAGLAWNDSCLAPERKERTVMTASYWQVRQPVYTTSVERWRNYEPWIGELRELAPEA